MVVRRPASALIVVCLIQLATCVGWAQSVPKTEHDILWLAFEQSPDLAELAHNLEAARASSEAAGDAIPQPMFGYRFFPLPTETREGPQRHIFSLAQTIPWPGVLSNRRQPGLFEAQAIEHQIEAEVLELAFEVDRRLLHLQHLNTLMAILDESWALNDDVIDHVESTMAYSGAGYTDILRLTLAGEMILDQRIELERDRDEALIELKRFLDIEGSADLQIDFGSLDCEARSQRAVLSIEDLLAAAASHPSLDVLEARGLAFLARAEVAEDRGLPWPTLSVSYGLVDEPDNGMEGGTDIFQVGISIPLPIFQSQYQQAARGEEARAAGVAERRALQARTLATELERSVVHIEALRAQRDRFVRELIPMAEDIAIHMLTEFEYGTAGHTDYLQALQDELRLEMREIQLRYEIAVEVLRIDTLTGALPTELGLGEDVAEIVGRLTLGEVNP